jgi:hypothetical protein
MTAVDQWAVAVRKPIDRVNPLAGYDVVVFEQRSEANARQVFAGRVKVAGAPWGMSQSCCGATTWSLNAGPAAVDDSEIRAAMTAARWQIEGVTYPIGDLKRCQQRNGPGSRGWSAH